MATQTTEAYRTETVILEDGLLQIQGPFRVGESVEVIVLSQPAVEEDHRYPLRGLPYRFDHPYDEVDADDWDAAQ